jgi:hypothetical protein
MAKGQRRKSAMERLEKHLGSHVANHPEYKADSFEAHDKRQKEELKHLQSFEAN